MSLILSNIRDQKFAVDTLERAISSHKVHHAYLFEGPAGVGKSTTALALAMALNCQSVAANGCDSCVSCRKIATGNHPDVRTLAPLEGKQHISIESVREVERWFSLGIHEGKAKILIIAPADAMTEPAANALLKTLEEPRSGHYLLLITATSQGMLPTVRSRCQSVRFSALSDETMVDLICAGGVAEDEAKLVASLAGGSMKKATQYAGETLLARIATVETLLDGATRRTPELALEVAEQLRSDKDEAFSVLELFLRVLEELLWFRSVNGDGASNSPLIQRFGQRLIDLTKTGTILGTTRHIAAVHRAMTAIRKNNMNPQLAIEAMVMAMRNRADDELWTRIGVK